MPSSMVIPILVELVTNRKDRLSKNFAVKEQPRKHTPCIPLSRTASKRQGTASLMGRIIALFILLAIPSISIANPISDTPREQAYSDLKAKLSRQYPDRYTTIKLLLNSGMRAYDNLASIEDGEVSDRIMERLKDTYYPGFSAIWLLYRKEMESYRELNSE